jgi:hypothetical protein
VPTQNARRSSKTGSAGATPPVSQGSIASAEIPSTGTPTPWTFCAKRQRNIRKALERIIEQAETVEVNASAVVAAIQAYAKISNSGQWVERVQGTNMNELFDRMTTQELDDYARDGSLPEWFTNVVGATASDSLGVPSES